MTSPIGREQVFFFLLLSLESIESRKSLREAESADPREGKRDPHIRSTACSGEDLKKHVRPCKFDFLLCFWTTRRRKVGHKEVFVFFCWLLLLKWSETNTLLLLALSLKSSACE